MKHDIIQHSPTHFECQKCHKIWQTLPRSHSFASQWCPGIVLPEQHDIIKQSANRFECRACHQTWSTSSPRSKCPGISLYRKYAHDPLMTRLQLGYAGYEIANRHLPAPSGCFRSGGRFVLLYDSTQAVKKTTTRRKRPTITVTDFFWPRACVPFIDALIQAQVGQYSDRFELYRDVAEMAYHLSAFNRSDVEGLAGDYLHLTIAPCLVHISYSAFQGSASERGILVKSIMAAYQKQKVAS